MTDRFSPVYEYKQNPIKKPLCIYPRSYPQAYLNMNYIGFLICNVPQQLFLQHIRVHAYVYNFGNDNLLST